MTLRTALFCCLAWGMLLGAGGCAGGFDYDRLDELAALPPALKSGPAHSRARQSYARLIAEARQARGGELRSPLPISIAVHLFESQDNDWSWSSRDRGEIASWGRKLKSEGIVDSMFVMSSLVSTGSSVEEIRLAAARHGADAVLILKASAELDTGINPLSIFYLTLLGYYVVPGSNAEAVMIANGALIDVDSGRLLVAIAVEGIGGTFAPGGFLEPATAVKRAKGDALDLVSEGFLAGVREYAEQQAKLPPPPRRRPQVRRRRSPY